MSVYYFALYFFLYGFLGWCTEVVFAAIKEKKFINRGFLNGPICPIYGLGVGVVVQFLGQFKPNVILLYIASVILVTALEWVTGFILEKLFHNKWWDYSNMPLNLNGYVCLLFSLVWGVACVIIVDFIHPAIHSLMVHLPVTLGMILLVLFCTVLIADIWVTASAIFKINRHLASMERIVAELRELSDNLGENLYKGVVEAMEKTEEAKQKLEVPESVSERIQALKENYNDLASVKTYISGRLIKAFPKMNPKKYKEAWEELRRRFKLRQKGD